MSSWGYISFIRGTYVADGSVPRSWKFGKRMKQIIVYPSEHKKTKGLQPCQSAESTVTLDIHTLSEMVTTTMPKFPGENMVAVLLNEDGQIQQAKDLA